MTNIDAVREIYEAFSRQDVPSILERMSDEVAWDTAYGDHEVPWLRARRGRSGVGEFFQVVSTLLEFEQFAVTSLLADGNTVVALVDLDAKVRATVKKIRERGEVHIWRFDAKGRIADFRHVVDTLQHHRAMQAS